MPKISVIVPVYKVEKYLARCVDSILAQTFKDYEIILVDDGSPDNCPAMCDEYAEKYDFIKVIHKENGGLSDARNVGIEYALTTESKWITFIDSDDWVHPQYLEVLYNACVQNNVDISCCYFKAVKDEKETIDHKTLNIKNHTICDRETLYIGNEINNKFHSCVAWAKLYKKTLWKEIRFPIGRLHEDQFTTYKLLYSCDKNVIYKSELYYYFKNLTGITSSEITPKRIKDLLDAYQEQSDFFYKNKFYKSFKWIFGIYYKVCKHFILEYKTDKRYSKVLQEHKKIISKSLKKYKTFIPPILKKYGYNKYVSGRAEKLINFHKDIESIRREKGFIRSLCWALKNYWKI